MRWRGSTIRISNAWSSSTTRPTRHSGGRSRIIAARSASVSSSSARTTCAATRPARCALRSRTPPPTPRSSASSTPTTWCSPDWLKDLVPAFADPKVGMIQAPQDHRDGERSLMHHAMNGEYAGFFDIGMVQRNEANAIIVHGTMCLIRRAALDLGRRLVERHHRRGLPTSACSCSSTAGRSTTPTGATATACCPIPSRPTRSSAIAGPMAACRS